MTGSCWAPLPETWRAAGDAVHVVQVDVPTVRDGVRDLVATLSDAERDRATRFRRATDRERFVVARGTLRTLLSSALRADAVVVAPSEIVIERGRWGKPFAAQWPTLGFNVSHAGDIVLVALARGREVGVDVEHARPDVPVSDLVPIALGTEERAWWEQVPPDDQHRAFFDLWTRREALVKAVGTGLGRTEIPWTGPFGRTPEEVLADQRVWTVHRFEVAPSYPAAVAAEGVGWSLQTWRYSPFEGGNFPTRCAPADDPHRGGRR